MFAVVDIAGFQEKVTQGAKLRVPLIAGEAGKAVTFDKVLLLAKSEDEVTVGAPYVAGATVEAKVLGHGKGEKVMILKMHRRKRYRRFKGHRQSYSEIEITKIRS
jgi:large subunit ribosomal protein L21